MLTMLVIPERKTEKTILPNRLMPQVYIQQLLATALLHSRYLVYYMAVLQVIPP
jgi:hypothetical protein